jgi:tRNA-dihydrouridine synthase
MSYLELGRICEANGVAAVALHGRTAKQMFRGEADWSAIGHLKKALSIPVIGNGDVHEADDAVRMMAETGCDGVMIGRAATKNPWIFRQIQARMSGSKLEEPSLEERRDLVLGHFRLLAEREPERHALHKLRKFTGWYTHGLPRGRKLRQQINQLPDVDTFLRAVEDFFDDLMAEKAA